jgi:hypothetical protein
MVLSVEGHISVQHNYARGDAVPTAMNWDNARYKTRIVRKWLYNRVVDVTAVNQSFYRE